MNGDLRKGWCPGALRPMTARDGLLVRLKITGGLLPAPLASTIADLAERHGNGLLDLSARANLQLRGVREATLPALLAGLDALDLLDADPEAEAVRNVLASPLAGLGRRRFPRFAEKDRPDIRPLVDALEDALATDRPLRALPAKFGFLVDDGGAPSLAGIAADVRFDWRHGERAFAVGLGGAAADALAVGLVAPDALVARATALAHRTLAVPGGPRRLRTMMREMGRDAVAACFGAREQEAAAYKPRGSIVGYRSFCGIDTLGLAAPFGRLDARMLRAAASIAAGAPAGELRLTPWRVLLIPHVPSGTADLDALAAAGFIVDPADPRLRVAACTGVAGCERGTTDTHADATALAALAAQMPGDGVTLHVSGCAKGCARPKRTAVTLIAHESRYDLVRDGRPGDAAASRGLDLAGVHEALAPA